MKSSKKNKIIILLIILLILITLLVHISKPQSKIAKQKKVEPTVQKINIQKIKETYNTYMVTTQESPIYKCEQECTKVGTIANNMELTLDDNYEINNTYYKILNTNYYIEYQNLKSIEDITKTKHDEYANYKNYIPFNEKIVTKEIYKLYPNNNIYIEINEVNEYPIIIKEENSYGVEFNNRLVYINKEDINEIKQTEENPNNYTQKIGVLNYHYVVNKEAGELNECVQSICMEDTQFESHLSYLKENSYYTASMRDLELWLDKKIQLPSHTTVLTIDDGWYVARAIPLLEKYQLTATLFLIGSLASPESYTSNYLEIHSHTWDMHTPGICNGTHGGAILCKDDNFILNDLKKSRESLNNTPYFCYPFYEYNSNSEKLLQAAGFRMAFIGGERSATQGINKYRIPRYVMVNYTTMNNFINSIS